MKNVLLILMVATTLAAMVACFVHTKSTSCTKAHIAQDSKHCIYINWKDIADKLKLDD